MAVVEHQRSAYPLVSVSVEQNPRGDWTRIYWLRCQNGTPVRIRLWAQHPQFTGGRIEMIVSPGATGTLTMDMPTSDPTGSGFGYGYEEV